jgi:hypothetical protein
VPQPGRPSRRPSFEDFESLGVDSGRTFNGECRMIARTRSRVG